MKTTDAAVICPSDALHNNKFDTASSLRVSPTDFFWFVHCVCHWQSRRALKGRLFLHKRIDTTSNERITALCLRKRNKKKTRTKGPGNYRRERERERVRTKVAVYNFPSFFFISRGNEETKMWKNNCLQNGRAEETIKRIIGETGAVQLRFSSNKNQRNIKVEAAEWNCKQKRNAERKWGLKCKSAFDQQRQMTSVAIRNILS